MSSRSEINKSGKEDTIDKNRMPVIVGVAQLVNREKTERQVDPFQMMAEAGRGAGSDASLNNLEKVDTLYVVNCLSKHLKTPTQDLSSILGIRPTETGYSGAEGAAPQMLVNRAAERIYLGKSQWVLICGAEAFYTHDKGLSVSQLRDGLSQLIDDRLSDDDAIPETHFIGDKRMPLTDIEMRFGLWLPVMIYAFFENALRAHLKRSLPDHIRELSSFCARMSEIASRNPCAWSQKARSAQEIAEVTEENRMVVYPYTKWMCSILMVNQAAAVLMTNLAKAEELGIPSEKIVYLRGCGEAEDAIYITERPRLWASPSVADAVDSALEQASLSLDEVEYLDFYSCFPSAPRITREMLGISPDDPRELTVTGGLPYFGGPGNNYVMHAICRMVEMLRKKPEAFGLIQALSWYISKHCVGLYSSSPGDKPWMPQDTKGRGTQYPRINVVEKASGKGLLESYAIVYDRQGHPHNTTVLGRDESGNRFIAKMKSGGDIVEHMMKEEPIGRYGKVEYDQSTATNLFYL